MTAKRWEIIDEEFISYTGGTAQLISNGECKIHLWERPQDAQLFCDKLNAINEEKEQLKFERERYKRLSEIRQESINNRILTIKEFIDNCSDKKVKKTLEQLFHSEIKEYDLSKKIRKLEKENEQLKTVINRYEKYSNKKNDELNFRQLDILKLKEENEELKLLIKKVLETTPIEHSLAIDLKNSIKELYK